MLAICGGLFDLFHKRQKMLNLIEEATFVKRKAKVKS